MSHGYLSSFAEAADECIPGLCQEAVGWYPKPLWLGGWISKAALKALWEGREGLATGTSQSLSLSPPLLSLCLQV